MVLESYDFYCKDKQTQGQYLFITHVYIQRNFCLVLRNNPTKHAQRDRDTFE